MLQINSARMFVMKGESPNLHMGIGSSFLSAIAKMQARQERIHGMIPGLAFVIPAILLKSNIGPISKEKKLFFNHLLSTCLTLNTSDKIPDEFL
jgi:hypothetical protein